MPGDAVYGFIVDFTAISKSHVQRQSKSRNLEVVLYPVSNNEILPELSFLQRSTDTQITISRGFRAEL